MTVEIVIPHDLWDTTITPEGVLVNWLYEDGAAVEAGAKVAEIMVEKTNFDIASPAGGTLRIIAKPDSVLTPGTPIGEIKQSGGNE